VPSASNGRLFDVLVLVTVSGTANGSMEGGTLVVWIGGSAIEANWSPWYPGAGE
jgi:hypothetical protein